MKKTSLLSGFLLILIFFSCQPTAKSKGNSVEWKHLSTVTGDLQPPNSGKQQTASAVFDVDGDGINDFLIAERTAAPSMVWYRRTKTGWRRYPVETDLLHIEAGSAVYDIDRDGDLDVVFGGDARSNQVWWWENPSPHFQAVRWKRHLIKNSGANKHHDQLFGDFDGDGREELVFWNQGAQTLFLAEIPPDPIESGPWPLIPVYSWVKEQEPRQRGKYPGFKKKNEHEGLAKADIDGDGTPDIVGGGHWFKRTGKNGFQAHTIDPRYVFTRCAAGQLIKGGRPEVVLVVGDGRAPMMLYEWKNGSWQSTTLIDTVQDGHSTALVDFNEDGNLDIFNAEMRLGKNPAAKTRILLGDGKGHFREQVLLSGFGLHESRMADLDGDGDFDILGKPYNWQTPRLDIWLNMKK